MKKDVYDRNPDYRNPYYDDNTLEMFALWVVVAVIAGFIGWWLQ